jgi:hypothetical protein
MLEGLKPYPQYKLNIKITPKPEWRYTICIALRDLYQRETDPEMKTRLQYIATIAEAQAKRLYEVDSKWLMEMYPSVEEYNELMKREDSNG